MAIRSATPLAQFRTFWPCVQLGDDQERIFPLRGMARSVLDRSVGAR